MSITCEICPPYHPKVLHRSAHSHKEHWHEHQIAGARIFGISPPAYESTENLRLRLRALIKHSLQTYMHHNQTSHEARPHHVVSHPCTEAEFVTLFRGLPLFFHLGRYTLDMGGRPALDALNLVLGHGWDIQEEEGTHKTCFVATTVNEMEYFVRIACIVKDLSALKIPGLFRRIHHFNVGPDPPDHQLSHSQLCVYSSCERTMMSFFFSFFSSSSFQTPHFLQISSRGIVYLFSDKLHFMDSFHCVGEAENELVVEEALWF